MAAAALPEVSDLAAGELDRIRTKVEEVRLEFHDNPIGWVADKCFKLGLASTLLGAAGWVVYTGTSRAKQQYLSDIDQTLGIDQESPPTPAKMTPALPAAPAYVGQFNSVVTGLATLDHADPTLAIAQLQTSLQAAVTLQASIANGPGSSNADASGVKVEIARAIFFLAGYQPWADVGSDAIEITDLTEHALTTPVNIGSKFTPGPPDWKNATYAIGGGSTGENAKAFLNEVANDVGLQQPYDLSNPDTPSGPWGAVGSLVVTVELAAINAATGVGQAASTALQGATQAATNLVGDVSLLGRALINFPRVWFDGLGYTVSWGLNTIAADTYPWLLGLGIGLMVFGTLAQWFGPRLMTRLELGANARVATLWNRFDKWFKTRSKVQQVWTQKSTEAMVHSANASPTYVPETRSDEPAAAAAEAAAPIPVPPPSPGLIDAGGPAEAQQTEPEAVPGAASAAVSVPPPEPAPPPPPSPPEAPATSPPGPEGPTEAPEAPAVTPVSGAGGETSHEKGGVEGSTSEPGTLPEEMAPDLRAETRRASRVPRDRPPREWTADEILAAARSFEPGAGVENYGLIKDEVEAARGSDLRQPEEKRLYHLTESGEDRYKREHPGYGKRGKRHTGFQGGADEAMLNDYGD